MIGTILFLEASETIHEHGMSVRDYAVNENKT